MSQAMNVSSVFENCKDFLTSLYQTENDSMTHLASLGMQANSLRMDMTVFLIFLLDMTFP